MIGLTDNPEQREIRSNGPPLIIYQQTKPNESKNESNKNIFFKLTIKLKPILRCYEVAIQS